MAFMFLVTTFSCVVGSFGLSLLSQQKAPSAAVTAYVDNLQRTIVAGKDGPPTEADVTKTLESVNTSLDKIEEVLEMVNSTAYDSAAEFLSAVADFQAALSQLNDAAEAASQLPDAEGVMTQAQTLIGKANSTLDTASGTVTSSLSTVSTELSTIMDPLQMLANDVVAQYLDALTTINQGLYNVTAESAALAKKQKEAFKKFDNDGEDDETTDDDGTEDEDEEDKEEQKQADEHKYARKHKNAAENNAKKAQAAQQAEEDSNSHRLAKAHAKENTAKKAKANEPRGGSAKGTPKGNAVQGTYAHKVLKNHKDAIALLQYRAHSTHGSMSKSRVEAAVARKGGAAGDACDEASGKVSQANETLQSLSDKIMEVNSTVALLSMVPVSAILDGVDLINSTIAPLLDSLPEALAKPIASTLDTINAFKESAMGDAVSKISEYETMILDAVTVLGDVQPLTAQLQESIDQQCLNAAVAGGVPAAPAVPR